MRKYLLLFLLAGQALAVGPIVKTVQISTNTTQTQGVTDMTQPTWAIDKSSWNATTDTIYQPAHGFNMEQAVLLTSTGTLPAGLSLGTTYFIAYRTPDLFSLSSTAGNAANSVWINFTDQGSGIHTVTPLASKTLGLNSNSRVSAQLANAIYYGTTASSMGPQLFLGGRTQPTQPSELIHAEGTGNTANDYSADIAVYNTTGTASRLLASSGNNIYNVGQTTPAAVGYLIAYGSNTALNPAYWSGGPDTNFTANVTLQSATTNFFHLIQPNIGNTVYFWSENNTPRFEFCQGTGCGEMASILLNGIKFGGWSLAQLNALVTEPGMVDYCNNCTRDALCISTGTINSFVDVSSRTFKCQ